MIKPSRLALFWLAALLALMLTLGALKMTQVLPSDALDTPAWATLLALLLVGLFDAAWLRRLPSPSASRQLPSHLGVGRWSEASLNLHLASGRAQKLQVSDHGPAELTFQGMPQALLLEPGVACTLTYRMRALKRGRFTLSRCQVQLGSPLGFWHQQRLLIAPGMTQVGPDFAGLAAGQPSKGTSPLIEPPMGPLPGAGAQFKQLRVFRDGDSLRQVDWQASARQHRPIVREYQQEQGQQVILLLDCGQHMRSLDDGLTHFDHALNACLVLGQRVLRQGDALGFITFASDPPHYLAPRTGQGQFKALLATLNDVHTSQRPGHFADAARALLERQTRRALVVLVTQIHNEDEAQLTQAFNQLSRHHRVWVASLREAGPNTLREGLVSTRQEALDYCAAVEHLSIRQAMRDRLAARGIALLDARPLQLGSVLTEHYLNTKKAGTL